MKLGGFYLFTFILLPFVSLAADPPVRVSLSYDMIKGLPEDAKCLETVHRVFPALEIEDVPWKRIMLNLEYGKTDLTPCLFKTPERQRFADFFGPIAYLRILMVFPEHKDLNLDKIAPLKGVFLRGTSLIKQFTTPTMQVLEVNSIDTIFEMIRAGRADYTLMPENFANTRDTDGLSILSVYNMPLFIGISKKSDRNNEIMRLLGAEVPIAPNPDN